MAVDDVDVSKNMDVRFTTPPEAGGAFTVGGFACQDVTNAECSTCEDPSTASKGMFFEGWIDEVYVVRNSEEDRSTEEKFYPVYQGDTWVPASASDRFAYFTYSREHAPTDCDDDPCGSQMEPVETLPLELEALYEVQPSWWYGTALNLFKEGTEETLRGDLKSVYAAVPWRASTFCEVDTYFATTPHVAYHGDLVRAKGYNFAKSQWLQCEFHTHKLAAEGDGACCDARNMTIESAAVRHTTHVEGFGELTCMAAAADLPSASLMK
eukprot:5124617-Pyramimonas_sp.AAC.1